jgi:hypothetical protein
MPSTVSDLFDAVSLEGIGFVPWLDSVPSAEPGVYILTLSPAFNLNSRVFKQAPIDRAAISKWISEVPQLELDRNPGPSPDELMKRLEEFWLPDESVLYIGQTTSSLRKRVRQYIKTPLGDRKPHAGGHWIKTLSILDETFVHFAKSPDPKRGRTRTAQGNCRQGIKEDQKRTSRPGAPVSIC